MADESDWDTTKSTETDTQPSTSKRIFDQKTPHSEKHGVYPESVKKSRLTEMGDIWLPPKSRDTPLPYLPWANNSEVWQTMVYKEEATTRNRNCRLFEDPTSFLPRMRSILVDWIMEVCEAYHLRRITFYLALDYIDRYLTINPAVPKNHLQLIGISSLFVAAKLEEVYPPKLSEFSYVCDGACSQEDIIDYEILLLSSLGWDLNFMTPTGWLNLYMQIHSVCDKKENDNFDTEYNFFFPQYSSYQFVCASHLIDLFTLDPGYLLFSYSVIAASAMYFSFGKKVALKVSGLQWDDLKDCTEYMAVYYTVLRDTDDPRLHSVLYQETDDCQNATYDSMKICIPKLTNVDNHTMQTHVINTQHFEQATLLRLRRMGLTVEKTYEPVKTTVVPEDESDDSFLMYEDDDDVEDPENEDEVYESHNEEESHNDGKKEGKKKGEVSNSEEKPAVLMFEIGKSSENASEENASKNELNFFTSKKKYTFDEILIGIHNCTNKQLLVQSSSSQTVCSSDNLN
ncbi:hypothetical protein RN001_015673 [Aquatica leii]|uniref:Uncharacterized protein n=1 Tax=Aquatica leii TaxID=1421715 RepID=A0AAN7PMA8_9COLE|nr:hypothetical protein RN001_015673 [Aquatica leii]